jgi:hypothetical protein
LVTKVLSVHRALLVVWEILHKDRQVQEVQQDLVVIRDQLHLRVPKDRKVQLHQQDLLETKDQKDQKAQKVLKVTRQLETKVVRDREEQQEVKVMQHKDLQVLQVTQHRDLQVLRDQQVQVEIKVQLHLQDLRVLKDRREIKVSRDQSETRHKDHKVLKVVLHKVTLVEEETKVHKDLRVTQLKVE